MEVDRGRLADWGDDYDAYLERKEAALATEAREQAEFDRKLAREEVWIRTGIPGAPHAERRPSSRPRGVARGAQRPTRPRRQR
jgi:ATP-binding cassette subfamily F protein uup